MEIPGYKILETIGKGGMASVYLATQKSLNRQVALKVLSPDLVVSPEFCRRFLKEGKIVAQLSHPNIITIYDIGNHQDYYFMSMEYIEGGSLRSRIDGGVGEADAISVVLQVAEALGYSHDRGFLHRDIKPHNILFRSDQSVLLSDFGIAKNLADNVELTRDGQALGSPLYMSPEQIRGIPQDIRSDLYSLGIVMYQMLAGYAPYLASTAESTARMHLSCPIPRLPKEYEHYQPVISRLLAKSPINRFPSAWELIRDLKQRDREDSSEHQGFTGRISQSDQQPIASPGGGEIDEPNTALRPTEEPLVATRDEDVPTAIRRDDASPQHRSRGVLWIGFTATAVFLAALFYPWGKQTPDTDKAREAKPVEIKYENQPRLLANKGDELPGIGADQGGSAVAPELIQSTDPASQQPDSGADTSTLQLARVPDVEREPVEPTESGPGPVVNKLQTDTADAVAVNEVNPLDLTQANTRPLSLDMAEPAGDLTEAADGFFNSLVDPGVEKKSGRYVISEELESAIRQQMRRVIRDTNGALRIQLETKPEEQGEVTAGLRIQIDRLGYIFRNYSGFNVDVVPANIVFSAAETLNPALAQASAVRVYLAADLLHPERVSPSRDGQRTSSGSEYIELVLRPSPKLAMTPPP